MQFAFISRSHQPISPNGAPQFLGNQFKLLNPILLDTTAISPTDANPSSWEVGFFQGSPFAQHLRIDFMDVGAVEEQEIDKFLFAHSRQSQEWISRVFFAAHDQNAPITAENITSPSAALLRKASLFIRNSKTLSFSELNILSNSLRYIDSRGMMIFSYYANENTRKHNYRLALLLMLGHAYRLAMQQISESLAEILKNQEIEKLDALYREAATFNARFYFAQPIRLNNYPSASAWEDIRDSLQLEAQNQEISRQITQVHQILSHCQSKEEQSREKEQAEREKIQLQQMEKSNRKIALFGTIISLIGLVEVANTLMEWFGA